MYDDLMSKLNEQGVPNDLKVQVSSVIKCAKSFIDERKKYDLLKQSQNILNKYFDDEGEELDKLVFISDKYILLFLYRIFKKLHDGSEYNFFYHYLKEPRKAYNDYKKICPNNELNLDYEYFNNISISFPLEHMDINEIKATTENLEKCVFNLEHINDLVKISLKDAYDTFFTIDFHNYLMEHLECENYVALLINDLPVIRKLFTTGEIRKEYKNLIVFNQNDDDLKYSLNSDQIYDKIENILCKYSSVIDSIKNSKNEIEVLEV